MTFYYRRRKGTSLLLWIIINKLLGNKVSLGWRNRRR